jgi:AcrR family transcriptional regulator
MTLLSRQYTESPLAKRRQYQLKFELILSEAARLFNWQGSRATTLAEVAARLSLTKTCLYYYVDNKQDLIYKCYLSSCEMLLDRANRAHKLSASGRDKIVSMIDGQITQYAATLNGKGPHFAMLAEIYTLDEAQQKDVNLRWSEIFDVVSAKS